MAGEQYGMANAMPYQAPMGYGMPYYQPQQPQQIQQYQAQMEARLKGLEQRLNPNVQQPMSNTQQLPQPNVQPVNPAALYMVATMEEARNYAPDFNGTRQMFYIENDPDTIGMKHFDIGTGATNFTEYKKWTPDQQQQNDPQEAHDAAEPTETKTEGYLTHEDLKPLQGKIEALEGMCTKIMEKLEGLTDGKLSSSGTDDGAKQSASGTDDAASKRMDADGSKPKRNSKQSATAAAGQQDASKLAEQDS